ncbi:Ribonucleotide reductase inhibitor protein [Neofusicoccum parvum]|nr:Ribonucleotide reductase inhibitor protein [Neofusicoccum parvum]
MSASTHRSKRPFQPSITSYFARANRSDPDASPSPTRNDAQHQGLAAVPANVQASLLNVGMRVRKSVPEGYKTHKTVPPAAAVSAPYKAQAAFVPASAASRPTELLPFCGLHKTGGYVAQQPTTAPYIHDAGSAAATAHNPVDAHGIHFSADDFAFSSQESNTSTISTDSLPNAHKRRFEDEDEQDDGCAAGGTGRPLFPSLNTSLAVPAANDDDLQISPRTVYPVSHTAMPNLSAPLRPVARPKSRRRNGGGIADVAMGRQANGDSGLDFGEAEFLKPTEEWEGEVEMGGV